MLPTRVALYAYCQRVISIYTPIHLPKKVLIVNT